MLPTRPGRLLLQSLQPARLMLLLGAALVTALVLLGSTTRSLTLTITSASSPAEPNGGMSNPVRTEALTDDDLDLASSGDRPVYAYSVVPGGVATPAALRRAVAGDPVVRAHYANFDLANTRLVRLTTPRTAHVSYRIGDSIYWTKRTLLLRAGETMLTDGVHYARTRCGNQLAVEAPVTSPGEPAPAVFDTPLPGVRTTHALPSLPAPVSTLADAAGVIAPLRGVEYLGGLASLGGGYLAPTAAAGGNTSLGNDFGSVPPAAEPPLTTPGDPTAPDPTAPAGTIVVGFPPGQPGPDGTAIPLATPPIGDPGTSTVPTTPAPFGTPPLDPPPNLTTPPGTPRPQDAPMAPPPDDPPVTSVPEPSTLVLALGAGAYNWRRCRS